jgi:hypothetical protein
VRILRGPPFPPFSGVGKLTRSLGGNRQILQCPGKISCQAGPLQFDPLIELGRITQEKPIEERTLVQIDGAEEVRLFDRHLEHTRVGLYDFFIQAEVIVVRKQRIVAELST